MSPRPWWVGWLVPAGLVLAWAVGQAGRVVHGTGTAQLDRGLGAAVAAVGVLAVAGMVCLASLLVRGHWHPFRYQRVAAELMTEAEYRALMAPQGIVEEHPGVWSGPALEASDEHESA